MPLFPKVTYEKLNRVKPSPSDIDRIDCAARSYLEIRNLVARSSGNLDGITRKKYFNFWSLGTLRPSLDFLDSYFQFLSESFKSKACDIPQMCIALAPLNRNAIPFSHVTKLAHTINPSVPIYDSIVADFYSIKAIKSGLNTADRLACYIESHAAITAEFIAICRNKLIVDLVDSLSNKSPAFKRLPKIKQIDSVITDLLI
jgi:hypothetical protein